MKSHTLTFVDALATSLIGNGQRGVTAAGMTYENAQPQVVLPRRSPNVRLYEGDWEWQDHVRNTTPYEAQKLDCRQGQ